MLNSLLLIIGAILDYYTLFLLVNAPIGSYFIAAVNVIIGTSLLNILQFLIIYSNSKFISYEKESERERAGDEAGDCNSQCPVSFPNTVHKRLHFSSVLGSTKKVDHKRLNMTWWTNLLMK